MLSFDTNVAVHAANRSSARHEGALAFVRSLAERTDVVVADLMLVELYLKLRNEKIFSRPLSAGEATTVCLGYRSNPLWKLVENAPVMDQVWAQVARRHFPFRQIIDLRLGLTLRHAGVKEFATTNTKDFQAIGFERVWDPMA